MDGKILALLFTDMILFLEKVDDNNTTLRYLCHIKSDELIAYVRDDIQIEQFVDTEDVSSSVTFLPESPIIGSNRPPSIVNTPMKAEKEKL